VQGEGEVLRRTRSMVFAQALVTSDGEAVRYAKHAGTAIVQAQTGRVMLVPTERPDPLMAYWIKRFPGVFTPLAGAPEWIRAERPPALDVMIVQGRALARVGFQGDSTAWRRLTRADDADADLERVRPVFGAMGKTITLCGPAGAGHALKALNNYLSAAGLVAMCEALVVGEAFGLDPGTMVDVFNSSTGKSNATEVKGRQFVVPRSFSAGFTTALMAKDLRTAGDVANHLKLNMPHLQQAVAYWTAADGKLGKGADHTEIFRYAEMLAEGE